MEMKKRNWVYSLFLMGAIIMIMSSCSKDDNDNPVNLTNGKTTARFNSLLTYDTMTDQEGNIYKTITIGTQTWMAENLRTTKYRNGNDITQVTSNTAWVNAGISGIGAYCNYNNTINNDTIATFGRLYNWFTLSDIRNIAPSGWHVPTEAELTTLFTFLGGISVAGGKLKESGTSHWVSPSMGGNNSSGFTALPGGCRIGDGTFMDILYVGNWWSSSGYNITSAFCFYLNFEYDNIFALDYNKDMGLAIRCVRDL
jgi:uncharacterized protein (TIGR02145 family)